MDRCFDHRRLHRLFHQLWGLVPLLVCCTSLSALEVHLVWQANTEPDLSHYRIHRSSSADFTVSDETLLVDGISATHYDDLTIGLGTWYYRLEAVDESGNVSVPTAAVQVTITSKRRIRLVLTPAPDQPAMVAIEDQHLDAATVDGEAIISGADPASDAQVTIIPQPSANL